MSVIFLSCNVKALPRFQVAQKQITENEKTANATQQLLTSQVTAELTPFRGCHAQTRTVLGMFDPNSHRFKDVAHNLAPFRGERKFIIDNLLVRIHFIIYMIWWTGLAP